MDLLIEDLVRSHFPELTSPDLLREIKEVGIVKEAKRGEVLMDVDKYIKFMPLVTKGVIKIIRHESNAKEVLLYYLETGKTCAMSMTCCLQHAKSSIKATVEEDATMIVIPVQYVDQWMMKHSSWKNFIMDTYANRFDQLLGAIDAIAFRKMDERLLSYLKEKIKSTQIPFVASTQVEIASEINTSREVVSRMLKKLEMDQKVTIDKGKIYVM